MPTNDTNPTESTLSRFRSAYEQLLPELRALPEDELAHINIDVEVAVTTALGALPEIKALRDEIAVMPGFDLPSFDKLELYTLATGHAQALFIVASSPSAILPELADRAIKMRESLHLDATALAKRGLIDGQRLKNVKGSTGYRSLAFDLLGLVQVMRESWPTLVGKTAVQPAELDDAERLADQMLSAVGEREQGPNALATTTLDRQRAFTLFMRVYDQARRAITFLRWNEDDGDTIAPSLYAGRNGGRRRGDEPMAGVPVAPVTAPVVPVPSAAVSAPATAASQAMTAAGIPNSASFVR
jgi:hypothetical protein